MRRGGRICWRTATHFGRPVREVRVCCSGDCNANFASVGVLVFCVGMLLMLVVLRPLQQPVGIVLRQDREDGLEHRHGPVIGRL